MVDHDLARVEADVSTQEWLKTLEESELVHELIPKLETLSVPLRSRLLQRVNELDGERHQVMVEKKIVGLKPHKLLVRIGKTGWWDWTPPVPIYNSWMILFEGLRLGLDLAKSSPWYGQMEVPLTITVDRFTENVLVEHYQTGEQKEWRTS